MHFQLGYPLTQFICLNYVRCKAIKPFGVAKNTPSSILLQYPKLNVLKLQDKFKHSVAETVVRFSPESLPRLIQHLFFKNSICPPSKTSPT